MIGKLCEEIGKSGPFASLEEEVCLNVLRTADRLARCIEIVLRPSGLSPTQYNVLRILRGVYPQGLPCQEIARRMITRDADLTRLLDRLEKRGFVHRQRQTDDRRVVLATIAAAGLPLLADLDPVIAALNQQLFAHMERPRLILLLELAEQARERTQSMIESTLKPASAGGSLP